MTFIPHTSVAIGMAVYILEPIRVAEGIFTRGHKFFITEEKFKGVYSLKDEEGRTLSHVARAEFSITEDLQN